MAFVFFNCKIEACGQPVLSGQCLELIEVVWWFLFFILFFIILFFSFSSFFFRLIVLTCFHCYLRQVIGICLAFFSNIMWTMVSVKRNWKLEVVVYSNIIM